MKPEPTCRPLAPTAAAVLGLLAAACGQAPMEVEIETTRVTTSAPRPAVVNATNEVRFGGGMPRASAPVPASEPENPLEYTVPEGWTERPSSQMRLVDLQVDPEGLSECYVSFLPGTAGGLVDNVNRWRRQMGLPPLSEDEVLTLPRRKIIGQDATLIDLEGDFTGMGGDPQADFSLLGAIFSIPTGTIFVKMTGPSAIVRAERGGFDVFCDSLTVRERDPHAGHDHAEGEGHDHGEGEHGGVTPPPAGGSASSDGLAYEVPSGWRAEEGRSMRLASFVLGASGEAEAWVSVLGGDGGGLEPNLNRWQSQLGLPPLGATEIDALPRLSVLGVESHFFEGYGNFSGMGSDEQEGAGLLGVVCALPGSTLFVKMVGPEGVVRAERDNFVRFAESLRSE